jgi:hypothetical protein
LGTWKLAQIRPHIGQLLALLAIVSLVLAPFVRPAMAMPMAMASMDDAMAPDSDASVASNDMPCCPSQPSLPDCSKDCPLMALCVTGPLHFASQTVLIIPLVVAGVVSPSDPPDLVSVAYAPPRKPPKI